MGITISFAGKPSMNASRISPSMPRNLPGASRNEARCMSMVLPHTDVLASTQIISPAGAATAQALPKTKIVLSKMERTITLPIWGLR